MSTMKQPPEPLQRDSIEARVVKQKIWQRMWRDNQHFMGAIVGREGSGKSWTALKLAEAADPSFHAERVMFEPQTFLERLQEWKENDETKGKMVVADEAGVGLGVRTWYQKDQILFNQVLQIIRDENMGIIFTLPRLNELDSQARGRLHAFMKMVDKENGEWARFKYLNWKPTRDERDEVYRSYPQMRVNGVEQKVKYLSVGPPSMELVEAYSERKSRFQTEIYQEAIDEMEDSDEEEQTPKDVAGEIESGGLDVVVAEHGNTGEPYISKELIQAEFDVSKSDARAVKALLDKRFNAGEASA